MFIVAYDIDGVILHNTVPPRRTVNAAYYCMFLQHHLHPVLRRKPTTLGGTEPHHSSWQCKESHRCCWCHRPLASLAIGDSGTSTVLNWYESMWLRSLRYNTGDELIYAIGESIQNINKDGHAYGVRHLPNIWQKMIKGWLYWRYINVVPLWIKPCQKYWTVAMTFFYPTLVTWPYIYIVIL